MAYLVGRCVGLLVEKTGRAWRFLYWRSSQWLQLHKKKMTYTVLDTSTLATTDAMASILNHFKPPFDHGSHGVCTASLGLDGVVFSRRWVLFPSCSFDMVIPCWFGNLMRLSEVAFDAGAGILAPACTWSHRGAVVEESCKGMSKGQSGNLKCGVRVCVCSLVHTPVDTLLCVACRTLCKRCSRRTISQDAVPQKGSCHICFTPRPIFHIDFISHHMWSHQVRSSFHWAWTLNAMGEPRTVLLYYPLNCHGCPCPCHQWRRMANAHQRLHPTYLRIGAWETWSRSVKWYVFNCCHFYQPDHLFSSCLLGTTLCSDYDSWEGWDMSRRSEVMLKLLELINLHVLGCLLWKIIFPMKCDKSSAATSDHSMWSQCQLWLWLLIPTSLILLSCNYHWMPFVSLAVTRLRST